MTGVRAFLGFGTNLGDRWAILAEAVGRTPDVAAVSPVYETEPVGGPEGQGAYLNCVVELETELGPWDLLEMARGLEAAAHRVRLERWGPRTLDVDVLWVEGVRLDDEELSVPHPRMWERAFVLVPLSDLAPDLVDDDALDAVTGAGKPEVRLAGRLAGHDGPSF